MKYAMQYVYPALFAQKKEGGYAIEFPDFPWLHAKGKTWTTMPPLLWAAYSLTGVRLM